MDPISCPNCGARFPVSKFDEGERKQLQNQNSYESMIEEQGMLLKVQGYYQRHPEAEDQIKPDFLRMLESDDPRVHEQLCAGVPFDRIEFRDNSAPPPVDCPEDAEVVEYLRLNSFSLKGRLEFVSERVEQLAGSVGRVKCLHCSEGKLRVRPEDWVRLPSPTRSCGTGRSGTDWMMTET